MSIRSFNSNRPRLPVSRCATCGVGERLADVVALKILSFWSRGAQSHFAGREGALSLGGDVRTTMLQGE